MNNLSTDKDPIRKILMAFQYATQNCANLINIMFHGDGIYPNYNIINEHMISKHYEGIVPKYIAECTYSLSRPILRGFHSYVLSF